MGDLIRSYTNILIYLANPYFCHVANEFTISLTKYGGEAKRYQMQVRIIKETNQVIRFCIHAKHKELYIEKRVLEKTNQWKITSMVNCGIPSTEDFRDMMCTSGLGYLHHFNRLC